MSIHFSICIPTMDRFDDFLDEYLEIYLDMKEAGIIDEIIVTDENGNDYKKILEKYGDEKIRVYKNETKLGAFKNKLRAVSYANPENFIAVIDSDNLVDHTYFDAAIQFIQKNKLKVTDDIVLCPYHTISDFEFDYSKYLGETIDYLKVRQLCTDTKFHMMLNTGNYIITSGSYRNLKYDDQNIEKAGPNDVIYKHLLAFYQNPRYRVFVVENMKYIHVVHINSFYLQTHQAAMSFYNHHIIPTLCSI